MFVYAGIDEAGYGPFFGPLTVARWVLCIPSLDAEAGIGRPPDLWARLGRAVCRRIGEVRRTGKVAVNDSKLLTSKAAGFGHLERGVLSFAGLMEPPPAWDTAGDWLDAAGAGRSADAWPPWLAPTREAPWPALPAKADVEQVRLGRGLLQNVAQRIGVQTLGFGVEVVPAAEFNQSLARTGSKARLSFEHVAVHLRRVLDAHGRHTPLVVVDRQSGRTRYGGVLRAGLPGCAVSVLEESLAHSAYHVDRGDGNTMHVRFQPEAEAEHMPVALASMAAKFTRELLMTRFKSWWSAALPAVEPTAGYGVDGLRFGREIAPHLERLGVREADLRRRA